MMEMEMEMEMAVENDAAPESEDRPLERLTPAHIAPQSTPVLGIYGWKKRCLYFSLLLLLVMILVNLGLTLWIIFVLDFNQHGMGKLRITDSGLRMQGVAEFTNTLYAETVASDQDMALLLQSQKSVNLTSGNSEMVISPEKVTVDAQTFSIYTHDSVSSSPGDQPPVLSVTNRSISVNADTFQVGGALGVTIENGVETNSLRPPPGRGLSLEARGGRLDVVGGEGGVRIEGGFPGGKEGVVISSDADLSMESRTGSIVFASSSILMLNLPISGTPSSNDIMEVCACSSGKLYLVPTLAAQGCQNDNGICDS